MAGTDSLRKLIGDAVKASSGVVYPLRAPAKINLRLSVRGRRDDGYHLLDMVNCTLQWADELGISLSSEPVVRLTVEPGGSVDGDTEGNLAVRAFRAFFRELGFPDAPIGISCHLTKRLPVGAGLGGGSSDAAAVLRCLGSVLGAALDAHAIDVHGVLHRAAITCGADVPFFLTRGLCHVTGIGERVAPLELSSAERHWVLVVVPGAAVNTKEFYSFYRTRVPTVVPAPLRPLPSRPFEFEDLLDVVDNDFEPHVCALAPAVRESLALVRGVFPVGSAVTGSGAALFALVPPNALDEARELQEQLRRHDAESVLTWLEP